MNQKDAEELAKTELEKVGMLDKANSRVNKISGGQKHYYITANNGTMDAEEYLKKIGVSKNENTTVNLNTNNNSNNTNNTSDNSNSDNTNKENNNQEQQPQEGQQGQQQDAEQPSEEQQSDEQN